MIASMLPNDPQSQSLLRMAAWAAIVLFGAGLIWTGVQTAGLFWSEQAADDDSAIVISPPGNNAPSRVGLARWHLFGRADEVQSVDVVAVDVPETELDLTLKGILSSTDPAQGRAIIADSEGQERHYRLEDTLPGGATVEAIEPTRIVLLYRGRMETLTLEELRRAAASRNSDSQPQPDRSLLTGANTPRVAGNDWQRLQDQLRTDPVAAAQSIPLPIPVMGGDGKVRGFRPNPGTSPALLSQLGLRKSDIIISVNGSAVSDPAQMMGVWQQIQQTQSASVVVERNGRQVPLNITLRQ